MKAQSLFLVSLLFTNLLRAQEPALHIAVIAGEDAKQRVNEKAIVEPAVQVEDQNGKPVAGAAVVFSLPEQGPGGSFGNGGKTITAATDSQGRATAKGLHLNRLTGPFNIHVTATYESRSAIATIAERSSRVRALGAFGISTKTWVLVGFCVLAIAGGIVAAKQFRSGPNPNVLTATPGTPVVGGPQ